MNLVGLYVLFATLFTRFGGLWVNLQSVELVKHSVVLSCLFIHYLRKELYQWEKTHTSEITFLMANEAWEVLIPQIFIDFHDWENHTCTRKLLLNLFQTSKINKLYIKQDLQIYSI